MLTFEVYYCFYMCNHLNLVMNLLNKIITELKVYVTICVINDENQWTEVIIVIWVQLRPRGAIGWKNKKISHKF